MSENEHDDDEILEEMKEMLEKNGKLQEQNKKLICEKTHLYTQNRTLSLENSMLHLRNMNLAIELATDLLQNMKSGCNMHIVTFLETLFSKQCDHIVKILHESHVEEKYLKQLFVFFLWPLAYAPEYEFVRRGFDAGLKIQKIRNVLQEKHKNKFEQIISLEKYSWIPALYKNAEIWNTEPSEPEKILIRNIDLNFFLSVLFSNKKTTQKHENEQKEQMQTCLCCNLRIHDHTENEDE